MASSPSRTPSLHRAAPLWRLRVNAMRPGGVGAPSVALASVMTLLSFGRAALAQTVTPQPVLEPPEGGLQPVPDLPAVGAPTPTTLDDSTELPRHGWRALWQTGALLTGGLVWYWRNLDFNAQDWELHWDWPSWKRKIVTFDALRFDTNDFVTNARDHSRAGTAYYLVGRANGLGMATSLALDFGATMIWEYMVEFKELPSLNDIIVNTAAGPSIGEPMLQLGRFFSRGRPTLLNRVLSIAFAPFDAIDAWLDDRGWPGNDETDSRGLSVERGHAFMFFGGLRTVNFAEGQARVDESLGFDAEVVMARGYGRPGRWDRWVNPGDWSRVHGSVTVDGDGWQGTVFHSEATYWGHYRQDVSGFQTADGALQATESDRGWGLFLGTGGGFDYETRHLAVEYDRTAIINLLGPRLDLTVWDGDLALRWEVAAYGDFGMVDSHALGPESPAMPDPPLTSVIRAQGYYYGLGGTAFTRLRLGYRDLTWIAELRGHRMLSIDHRNREDSPLDDGLTGFSDDRGYASTTLLFQPWRRAFAIAVNGEIVGRRGSWQAVSRSSRELSLGVQLLLVL